MIFLWWCIASLLELLRPVTGRSGFWLGCVVALCLGLSTFWIAPWYSKASFFETDFSEYCVAIIEMEKDPFHGDMPPKRTRLAALLPSVFSQWMSLIDGLALSSSICTVLVFGLVYFWASMLGGVGAGLLSVGILWLMAPMVLMGRFLTFYPPIVLCTVYAATALVAWGRFRTGWSALFAGSGIALCMLIDVRGVVWAVPYWIGAMALLSLKDWRKFGVNLSLIHLPIWCSWFGGWWSYVHNAASLEKQMDVRPLYVGFDEGNVLYQPPWTIESHFVWGWFDLRRLGDTLNFLWTQRGFPVPQAFLEWQSSEDGPIQFVHFWWGLLAFAFLMGGWRVWNAKFGRSGVERVLLLLCSISPFLLLFHSLQDLVEQHIRFYMHVCPGIAVLIGLSVARFSERRGLEFGQDWQKLVWFFCISLFLWATQFTSVSPFYANAKWRVDWRVQALEWQQMRQMQSKGTSNPPLKAYGEACYKRVQNESLYPNIYP